jgi:hypothetical protein
MYYSAFMVKVKRKKAQIRSQNLVKIRVIWAEIRGFIFFKKMQITVIESKRTYLLYRTEGAKDAKEKQQSNFYSIIRA